MFDLPETAILYADSAHGVYIPQYFAESINRYTIPLFTDWVSDLDTLCKGPDEEFYWDIWSDVLDRLTVYDRDSGTSYRLYQDGDLWLVPEDWNPED